MIAALLLSVAALGSGAADDPIRIALSDRARYATGDAGRVEVAPRDDGYLLVLQADANGAVRVLFPIEPDDDPFVEGGATYQLRDRAGRPGVVRASQSGAGVVLAALSPQPLDFSSITRNGRWDASSLRLNDDIDAEYALRDIAVAVAGSGMEYAAASYSVLDLEDDYRYAGGRWGGAAALGYGWGGWGGWGFNRWGGPFFYDPFFGYGYGGFGYGYGAYGGWGGWGYGFGGRPIIVTPSRPRITGYEARVRGRNRGRVSAPAQVDRSRDANSGGGARSAPAPRSEPSRSSGGRSSSTGRGGREWGGRPR